MVLVVLGLLVTGLLALRGGLLMQLVVSLELCVLVGFSVAVC